MRVCVWGGVGWSTNASLGYCKGASAILQCHCNGNRQQQRTTGTRPPPPVPHLANKRVRCRAHALFSQRIVAEVQVAQLCGRERGAHDAQRVERLVLLWAWGGGQEANQPICFIKLLTCWHSIVATRAFSTCDATAAAATPAAAAGPKPAAQRPALPQRAALRHAEPSKSRLTARPAMTSLMSACSRQCATVRSALAATCAASRPKLLVLKRIYRGEGASQRVSFVIIAAAADPWHPVTL